MSARGYAAASAVAPLLRSHSHGPQLFFFLFPVGIMIRNCLHRFSLEKSSIHLRFEAIS